MLRNFSTSERLAVLPDAHLAVEDRARAAFLSLIASAVSSMQRRREHQ